MSAAGSGVHTLSHAIKVDQKTEEDLVGGGAVLVDTAEIAQDGDARHVLTMECKHT